MFADQNPTKMIEYIENWSKWLGGPIFTNISKKLLEIGVFIAITSSGKA